MFGYFALFACKAAKRREEAAFAWKKNEEKREEKNVLAVNLCRNFRHQLLWKYISLYNLCFYVFLYLSMYMYDVSEADKKKTYVSV